MRFAKSSRSSSQLAIVVFVAALVFGAWAGRADFSGDFSVTPPAAGRYTNSTATFGNWSVSSAQQNGVTVFDSTSAPASVALETSASAGIGNQSLVGMSIVAPAQGTVEFDYNLTITGAGTSFQYFIELDQITIANSSSSGHITFEVNSGDDFGFLLQSNGLLGNTTGNAIISSFSFVPIPEPSVSSLGAMAGLALGGFWLQRKRSAARPAR